MGCTKQNKPIIESSFHELLAILDTFATRDEFIFGTRPSLADFGLFGQLKTLASDHTAMLIMRNTVPSVYDWVRRLEDSSGIEGEWHDFADMRPAVSELLKFSARYYLPFLEANANAHAEGADALTVELAGRIFQQPTFKYQVKCYDRLRKLLQNERVDALCGLLAETECLQYLE